MGVVRLYRRVRQGRTFKARDDGRADQRRFIAARIIWSACLSPPATQKRGLSIPTPLTSSDCRGIS